MARKSAGILLYRLQEGRLEVFLAHMGGPYWQDREEGAWTIPKGEYTGEEDPEAAARREFQEETGFAVEGPLYPLEPIRQAGGKWVQAYIAPGEIDPGKIRSNYCYVEWPPRSGKKQAYPEIDRAAWMDLETARRLIIRGQQGLLDQLEERLKV